MATPILIAGPTGSGKSRLALGVARRANGLVINADSMQVYEELRILTARPRPEDLASARHSLYGHVPISEAYSVGRWITDIATVLADAEASGLRPIIVGGTGLYYRALTEGLAQVPDVPPSIRTWWRERAATLPTSELHGLLEQRSSAEAARLNPTDRNRILRALEVIDGTGRTLPEWQVEAASSALVDANEAISIVVSPQRAELYDSINRRFLTMLEQGALDEARVIANKQLDPALPGTKSIGLSALLAHLAGEIDLDEAIVQAQTETRNYAKRQSTWFRNQMPDWRHASPTEAAEKLTNID